MIVSTNSTRDLPADVLKLPVPTRPSLGDSPLDKVGDGADLVSEEETDHAPDLLGELPHNLFKPLLLFFYMGFLVPILQVEFEFPHMIYQGLTIYLLVSIGWHGGEELAKLDNEVLTQALKFMGVGFLTNFVIGILAYFLLRSLTRLRRVDAATVAGYYGSDSAGTFATCMGVLNGLIALGQTEFKPAAYMPVMLAVMEIPGCLVALYLVSRLRHGGMDALGNMPDEPGYDLNAIARVSVEGNGHGHGGVSSMPTDLTDTKVGEAIGAPAKPPGLFSRALLHEVFLNPGLYLLFGGILIGFVSQKQGTNVTKDDDTLFLGLFQGLLCLFLLEMGMTASRKLKDLQRGGVPFIILGVVMPVLFATFGIVVAHVFSMVIHQELTLGTYTLFAVLCGAASYIAVPAVQRLAIPEASPTLPLAASLGLTFSFNVTVGIPMYIEIARAFRKFFPVT